MREENWEKAEQYALKSLEYNQMNLYAKQLLIVLYRKSNHAEKALSEIEKMTEQLPLLHWVRFEEYLLEASTAEEFSSLICNELSFETYMEMAVWYESIGCLDEAITLLSFVDTYPIALYQKAYIYHLKGDEKGAMVEKTQEWPENLGVGKPDEELIDTRLEDYMAAIAYVEQGQSMQADKLFSQIASSNMSEAYFDSNNLLVVLALRNLGKVDMADSLVNEWKVKHVHNEIAQWCILVYNNEKKKATEILNKYEETEEIAPWNVGYRDYNFKLIRKLSRILKK